MEWPSGFCSGFLLHRDQLLIPLDKAHESHTSQISAEFHLLLHKANEVMVNEGIYIAVYV